MKQEKRIYLSWFWVVLGATLIALAVMNKVDSFWNGMGSGLLTVGILQILRFSRFQKNQAYREKMEVEYSDERNHFIRTKAWAWSGYLFILISAVTVIFFKLIGEEKLSMAAAGALCLMLVLYWISYFILQKKY